MVWSYRNVRVSRTENISFDKPLKIKKMKGAIKETMTLIFVNVIAQLIMNAIMLLLHYLQYNITISW